MEEQYTIKQILERYYFSDPEKFKHFSEIEELKLSSDFFQILIKMFEDENYFPKDELMRYKMTEILDYIKRTHQYYLEKSSLKLLKI